MAIKIEHPKDFIELARLTSQWSDLYEVLLQAVHEMERLKINVNHCHHPGCCCVCGHLGLCPECGPSLIDDSICD